MATFASHRSCTPFAALFAAAMLLAAGSAQGYTYQSPISEGCHEQLAAQALRSVRLALGPGDPYAPTRAETALIDDLAFNLPADLGDLGAASLLLGVRDNDTKGHQGIDAFDLSAVHGDPASQREHCLRRPDQDEPNGTAGALADCRDYIRSRVAAALTEGLDAAGQPDMNARTVLAVYLALNGRVSAELPAFWVYMGQALHAMEDAFTHTFRSPDGMRVRVVLNWVEFAEGTLVEARDGPPHLSALDQCAGLDPMRQGRQDLAVRASAELLQAALDPAVAPAARMAVVDGLLDAYLTLDPGCNAANRWCDAPENVYLERRGCAATGRAGDATAAAVVALALGLAAVARRRRRGVVGIVVVALGVALWVSLDASAARAETSAPVAAPCPCPAALASGPDRPRLGGFVAAAGSIDRTGMAFSAGVRYRLTDRWLGGLDVEWNPWASFETMRVRPGALNVYATVAHRYALGATVALRTTAHVGTSVLLFDLYGAPAGSVGLYLGINFLGLEIRWTRWLSVIVDPADVALAVPHLTGVPLTYLQYRFTVGLQIGA